jgi:hypothetical protein
MVRQHLKAGASTLPLISNLITGSRGEFHQVNDSNSIVGIYERTYEIGPRYVRKYGRLERYAKLMYGRGVFNYPR